MSLGRMSLKIVLGADVSALRSALAKALSYLGTYKQMIADINKRYPGLIVNISAAAAYYSSLGFTIKRAVDHARDFEFWMFRIKSLFAAVQSATEDVTEAYEDMRKEALKIGRTTVYSASQAADAMGKLIEAGFTSAEAIRTVGDVLKFAAISGLSLERASIIAVQILRAFGMEAEQLNKALGVMTIAAVESTGRISDMALSLGYVAGVAGELGLSIEETAMWVGLLTNVLTTTVGTFMQAGKAGRYLRTLLMQLSDPDVVRRLEAIGIQIWDESGERMRSLTEIIQDFRELAGQMTKRELFWLTDQLGLSQVAATALYYAMRADTSVVGRFQKELQDVSDWQRIYYERSQSLNWELQRLKNITDVLWITMGESMLPAVHRMVEAFAELAEEGSPAESVIRGIGKGLSEALLDPLSEAVNLFADLSDEMGKTKVSLEDLGEAIGHLATVAPVLLLIGKYIHPGLAIALGAAYAAWESNFGGMREVLDETFEQIKRKLGVEMSILVEIFTKTRDKVHEILKELPIPLSDVEGNFKDFVTDVFSDLALLGPALLGIAKYIHPGLAIALGFAYAAWKANFLGMRDAMEPVIEALREDIPKLIADIIVQVKILSKYFEDLGKRGVEAWKDWAKQAAETGTMITGGAPVPVGQINEMAKQYEEQARTIKHEFAPSMQESYEMIERALSNARRVQEEYIDQILSGQLALESFEFTGGMELPAQRGTVIQTDSVINIENLNVETPYDVDQMAFEMGYLTAEELRRRGIIIG